jgi:hypothetical protein
MTSPHRTAGFSALALALALAAVLALTGCTSLASAVDGKPAIVLTKKSFEPTITAAQVKASSVHEHIVTVVDKKTVTVDADVTGLGADPTKLAMRETLQVTGQPQASVVYVDQTFYVNLGQATQNGFLKLDTQSPGPLAAIASSVTGSQAQADPQASLKQLGDALLFVQQAGSPTVIDSVKTTPYLVGIDARKAAGLLGGLGVAATAFPSEVDIDYWIGSDGLPRRSSLTIGDLDVETSYSQWGSAPKVIAPAPAASGAAV